MPLPSLVGRGNRGWPIATCIWDAVKFRRVSDGHGKEPSRSRSVVSEIPSASQDSGPQFGQKSYLSRHPISKMLLSATRRRASEHINPVTAIHAASGSRHRPARKRSIERRAAYADLAPYRSSSKQRSSGYHPRNAGGTVNRVFRNRCYCAVTFSGGQSERSFRCQLRFARGNVIFRRIGLRVHGFFLPGQREPWTPVLAGFHDFRDGSDNPITSPVNSFIPWQARRPSYPPLITQFMRLESLVGSLSSAWFLRNTNSASLGVAAIEITDHGQEVGIRAYGVAESGTMDWGETRARFTRKTAFPPTPWRLVPLLV